MPQVRVRRASYTPIPAEGVQSAVQGSTESSIQGNRNRSRTVAVPPGTDGGQDDAPSEMTGTRRRSATTSTGTLGSIGRFLGRSSTSEVLPTTANPSMDNSHPLTTIMSGAPSAPFAPPLVIPGSDTSPQDAVSPLRPTPARKNSAVAVKGRARSGSKTYQSIFSDEPRRERSSSVAEELNRSDSPAGVQRRPSATSDVGLTPPEIAARDAQERRMLERLESGIPEDGEDEHHHEEVVDHLDVIDPQIATVSHLQNCTNSIMIPHIPALWSRKPIVTLPETPSDESLAEPETKSDSAPLNPDSLVVPDENAPRRRSRSQSVASRSQLSPDDALDRHVEHVLSKRDKLKRAARGLWDFLKTPMGVITAIYGFLVVFWGAAIVLFLLKWIDAGSDYNQKLWIEISSQVVNGLFTITGVGLIPWRAMDTYRIFVIWRLRRQTIKLRKQRNMLPLVDKNDLPEPGTSPESELVLSDYQQARLKYQQDKFQASQTWYRPHDSKTHRAFSINWAIWICILTDGNSFFQCILCGTMWGLNRFTRPPWTTGCLIPLSFLCGIGAAVMIWKGGNNAKKRVEVEKKLREALGMSLASAGFQLDKDAVRRTEAPEAVELTDARAPSDAGTHEKDAEDRRE